MADRAGVDSGRVGDDRVFETRASGVGIELTMGFDTSDVKGSAGDIC